MTLLFVLKVHEILKKIFSPCNNLLANNFLALDFTNLLFIHACKVLVQFFLILKVNWFRLCSMSLDAHESSVLGYALGTKEEIYASFVLPGRVLQVVCRVLYGPSNSFPFQSLLSMCSSARSAPCQPLCPSLDLPVLFQESPFVLYLRVPVILWRPILTLLFLC